MSEDNTSAPVPGPAPEDNVQRTRESTSPAAEEPQEVQQSSGLRLRSGTVLAGPPTKVSLQQFLDKLYEKARESDKLSTTHCDALDYRLSKSREQRLARIENFKRDTERFKEELVKFSEFSRSLNLTQNTSDRLSKSESVRLSDSECEGDAPERSVEDLLCDWLEASLTETSPEESPRSPLKFKFRNKSSNSNMPDYAKIAKLTAQLVPLFSGEITPQLGRELQTFLGCCKQTQQCLAEEEKEAFLQILPTRLRGDAYQLFASEVPKTFAEFEECLNRTYLPRESYQELVNKLMTTRQGPLEALTAFTSRLKQLLTLCKEAAETKYGSTAAPAVKTQLEDFAKSALKCGVINPHMCQYLLTLTESTLDELIQKALDMEKLQQSALFFHPIPHNLAFNSPQQLPAPHPMHPPQTYSASTYQPQGLPHTLLWQQSQNPASQNPQLESPSRPPTTDYKIINRAPQAYRASPSSSSAPVSRVTCRFCGIKGHTYEECLKRKNTPICQSCKNYGHEARDCRRNRPPPFTTQQREPIPVQGKFSNKPFPNSPGQNAGGPRVYNVRLKCDFCGRKGHNEQQCQQKRRWEKKSQGNDSQSTQKSPARL